MDRTLGPLATREIENGAQQSVREVGGEPLTSVVGQVPPAPGPQALDPEPRFKVGTTFKTRGKHPLVCTVTDFHTTRNLAGEVVKQRYVATHEYCGQPVVEHDIPATTIAMGLIKEG